MENMVRENENCTTYKNISKMKKMEMNCLFTTNIDISRPMSILQIKTKRH